jgi:hypothetical protein
MSALQAVVTCDEERVKLEKEAEILAAQVELLESQNCYCQMFLLYVLPFSGCKL